MVEDTMFSGESKNIEYKVSLPDKSEKYMKTIVAFANTQGGKLIVGVDDKTHQIVGVENDVLFQLMDGIANAVSDSCVPQIIPDIEPQTVDGKTVIVVSVEAGKNRPYYLKSKGKDNGTYIRVAGTSRQAFPEKIKELEMEGARISWDELTCVGYPVSEEATEKLCQDIEKFRKKAGMSEHSVKKEQLINWKILKQSEGQLLATNAYALLTSDYFSFSKTQCAVFKGTDRAMFLDKREFTGPIYTQIEEAVDFVLRNIRLGATIDGLVRKEKYELPPEAIREMIINAHCHRNLLDESCIQVAVYDDRLEVTSPGGLYNGSHDLRTPLTVILGHLQLLQKENLESSQAQRVKVIFSKAEKMKELVETFYDLSILEEQQTVPEKEKFNISNMLINLITENAVALEKENILPEINLPDYSIYVYSDKNMVERILQNLLTNAIKYSVGTIKITLMEKENNNIIFTIENPMSDSSEIDCNRLFDRFYTGDKSRHNGSTGLGLAVVKTLVAILGGNIVAKVHANSLIITLEL